MKKKIGLAVVLALLVGSVSGSAEYSERQMRLEERLIALGYLRTEADGIADEDTDQALRTFQRINRLTVSGDADEETQSVLYGDSAITMERYLKSVSEMYAGHARLQNGSTGDSVTTLQQRLTELGYFTGECDGIFGDQTRKGVCRFQYANGLPLTGVMDAAMEYLMYEGSPLTWAGFITGMCCEPGSEGANVRTLQRRLKAMGFFEGDCTGVYGEMTRRAVRDYQRATHMSVTGTADAETCENLYWGIPETLSGETTADPTEAEVIARLTELGYLETDGTGKLTVALKLFQAAMGLEMSGEADEATLNVLNSDSARTLEEASDTLRDLCLHPGEAAAALLADAATGMLGTAWSTEEDASVCGFDFLQNVFLEAGLPLVSPEDVLSLPRIRLEDSTTTVPGDVVVFRRAEGDWNDLLFAICTQPGYVAYGTAESAYVLESSIARLATGEVSTWTPAE